jgi:hypothetical protein
MHVFVSTKNPMPLFHDFTEAKVFLGMGGGGTFITILTTPINNTITISNIGVISFTVCVYRNLEIIF